MRFLPLALSLLAALSPHAQPLTAAAAEAAPPPPLSSPSATGFFLEPVTDAHALFVPVDAAVAPDGRYFVAQLHGQIRVVMPDGTVRPEPLIDLADEVFQNGDRGLMGIALHPDFPATPHVYALYVVDEGPAPAPATGFRAHSRLTRFTIRADDPHRLDPASRRVLIGETAETGIPACFNSHAAGTVRFGHDGSLFVGSGDAGSWSAYDAGGLYDECFDGYVPAGQDVGSFRSQWLGSPAGKVLRVDPETGLGLPGNPFYTGDPAAWASRVWALGLRNPFRFTLAPRAEGATGPGTLYIGDVGSGAFEEIDRSRGGENFGWPCYEGARAAPGYTDLAVPGRPELECARPRAGALTPPYAYFHHFVESASAPSGRVALSITGGAFYEGTAYPERFRGALFFADYSKRWIAAGRPGEASLDGVEEVVAEAGAVVDIAYDPSTEALVLVDIQSGRLVRIRHTGAGPSPPVARGAASVSQGLVPLTVRFSAEGSFDPDGGPLAYRWTFGDSRAESASAEAEHQYGVPGTYAATLTVTNAAGASSQTVVPIRVGRTLPAVEVLAPTGYTLTGPTLAVAAAASDPAEAPEDLQVEWAVDLVHNEHVHPFFYSLDQPEGAFVVEPHATPGEVAYYRATVTVTDREGLTARATRTVRDASPSDLDVGAAATADDGALRFSEPVPINRLTLRGAEAVPDGLAVEVLVDGAWEPARFVHALVEPEGVQVLFAEVAAEAVRLAPVGADTAVAVVAQLPPEAVLDGDWEPADVGAPTVAGRTVPAARGGLLLAGGGDLAADAFHAAPRALAGDGAIAARVRAIDGGPGAAAGVVLRPRLDAGAGGVGLFVRADGALVVLDGAGAPAVIEGEPRPAWVRLRRVDRLFSAEVSDDGAAWRAVWDGFVADGPLWAGPAVAGGDADGDGRVALAWVEPALTTGRVEGPSLGAFAALRAYPNPSAPGETVRFVAGLAGEYETTVFDALGRVVLGPVRSGPTPSRRPVLTVAAGALSAGVYVVRARHLENGETRSARVTVVR